jgi:hypothetical protein
MSISSPRDFRYAEGRAADAGVVIDDPTYTLYSLDVRRNEVVFVQNEGGENLAAAPFYYHAQYARARRALTTPLASMLEAARIKGDRFDCAVFIYHCGRCGSTLLSRMFGGLNDCFSLSEPDVYTRLLSGGFDDLAPEPLLEAATRLYFHPPPEASPTHLAVKLRSFCIQLAPAIHRAMPSAIPLFLYRPVEEVVASGMRVFRYRGSTMWLCDRLHQARVTRPLLAWLLGTRRGIGERFLPAAARFSNAELARMGAVGLLAIAWVSAMERCAAMAGAGVDIRAIRYGDLIGPDNLITIAALLEHCRLPAAAAKTMIVALAQDSQAGSIVARTRQQPYPLTEQDRDSIRRVLSRSDVVDSEGFRPGAGVRELPSKAP